MSRAQHLMMGGFTTPEALVKAIAELRGSGHREVDAHSPYPIEEAEHALGLGGSRIPVFVLAGALIGAVSGYLLQWYCNAVDFPINIGGRPAHSPPSFVPITFELAILLGAFGAFFGLLALLGLPRLHHPVFEATAFRRASIDRYWISVAVGADPADHERMESALARLGAEDIALVENPS